MTPQSTSPTPPPTPFRAATCIGLLKALLLLALPALGQLHSFAQTPGTRSDVQHRVEQKKWGILNKETYGLHKVTAVLPRAHSFSFAGFYAAITQGYYASEGLVVRLLTPDEAGDPIAAVLEQRAEFGMAGLALLRAHSRGLPLILLAVLWQNSPCAIYIHPQSSIIYPVHLAGKPLLASREDDAPEIFALLRREGIRRPDILLQSPHDTKLSAFFQGHYPALASTDPLFPFYAAQQGLSPRLMLPRSYGINFPNGFVFTSLHLWKQQPELAAAFTRATLKGWQYALSYPSEMAELILSLPGVRQRGLDLNALLKEASTVASLVQPELIAPGHINPDRLQQTADEMRASGLLTGIFSLPDFLGRQPLSPGWKGSWLYTVVFVLAGAAAAIAVVFLALSRGMAAAESARTAKIRHALAEAEAENLARSAFLGSVSSDLRAPLLAMSSISRQLENEQFPPQQRRLLELLSDSITRLNKLIHDLLDLAMLQSGQLLIAKQPFDLRALLLHLEKDWKPHAESKGLEFTSHFDPALPEYVVGDPSRLRQVLSELLDNACKFTSRGSITLRVSPAAATESAIVFCVHDTGPGIPAENLDKILENGLPGDCSLTRQTGGAGLGLALASGLCRCMGGELRVQSATGLGTEFFFSLTLPPAPATFTAPGPQQTAFTHTVEANTPPSELWQPPPPDSEPPATPSPAEPPGTTTHPAPCILVAEDLPANQLVMRSLLIRLGCEVRVARTGEELIKLASKEPFDLVLMDVEMPEMSGIEAAKILRSRLKNKRAVPIIALSGYVDDATREACRKAGMDDFLPKPVQLSALAAMLSKWLPNARLLPAK